MPERNFDADASNTARAEKLGPAPSITLGGETFELPSELFYDDAVAMAGTDFKGAMKLLLDEEAFERFWSHRPTTTLVEEMAEAVEGFYAKSEGESPASGTS